MYYRQNPDAKITLLLKQLMSTTYLVYIQTQGAHWNVVGSGFPQLHAMFQDQYEELRDAVDLIAEHIRTYELMSPGSAKEFLDISNATSFEEVDYRTLAYGGNVDAAYLINSLISNHTVIADICRELAKITEDEPQTNDLAVTRLSAHQKTIWMLKSTNKQTEKYYAPDYGKRRRRRLRRNPWKSGDVKRFNKACASKAACRRKWPRIANAVLKRDGDKGKAIRIASHQVKKMGLTRRRNRRFY